MAPGTHAHKERPKERPRHGARHGPICFRHGARQRRRRQPCLSLAIGHVTKEKGMAPGKGMMAPAVPINLETWRKIRNREKRQRRAKQIIPKLEAHV